MPARRSPGKRTPGGFRRRDVKRPVRGGKVLRGALPANKRRLARIRARRAAKKK